MFIPKVINNYITLKKLKKSILINQKLNSINIRKKIKKKYLKIFFLLIQVRFLYKEIIESRNYSSRECE